MQLDADGWRISQLHLGLLGSATWAQTTGMRAEDRDHLEQRVTATRLLALGALALAVPKRRVISYLTISVPDGDWILSIPKMTSSELKGAIAVFGTQAPQPVSSRASTQDVTDRLRQLDDLCESGAITVSERDQKRAAILRDL